MVKDRSSDKGPGHEISAGTSLQETFLRTLGLRERFGQGFETDFICLTEKEIVRVPIIGLHGVKQSLNSKPAYKRNKQSHESCLYKIIAKNMQKIQYK